MSLYLNADKFTTKELHANSFGIGKNPLFLYVNSGFSLDIPIATFCKIIGQYLWNHPKQLNCVEDEEDPQEFKTMVCDDGVKIVSGEHEINIGNIDFLCLCDYFMLNTNLAKDDPRTKLLDEIAGSDIMPFSPKPHPQGLLHWLLSLSVGPGWEESLGDGNKIDTNALKANGPILSHSFTSMGS